MHVYIYIYIGVHIHISIIVHVFVYNEEIQKDPNVDSYIYYNNKNTQRPVCKDCQSSNNFTCSFPLNILGAARVELAADG